MINLNYLEENKVELRLRYLLAKPFPYLIIDEFCDKDKLESLYSKIPELKNKSRDYVFASNKFEKANYKMLGSEFEELYDDISSKRMNEFLSFIANENIFVDPENHGGGLHQGKKNSFLDMHLDFNYHPLKKRWYRNMNLLLYINKGWKPEYKGQLILEDLRNGAKTEVDVPFNRMIIHQTRPYTLHGYDRTNFPDHLYRTSIATYAYTEHNCYIERPRTTHWIIKNAAMTKKIIAFIYGPSVKVKNKIFGSRTAKNK